MNEATTSEEVKYASKQPKSKNKLLIPFILVCILAVAGICFSVFEYLYIQKTTEDQPVIVKSETGSTPVVKEYETVSEYMYDIIPYGVLVGDCDATVGDTSDTALLLPKMCFIGDYEKSDSGLKEKLTTDGFAEIEALHLGSAGPNIKAYKNEENGIICSVVYKEELENIYTSEPQKARVSCTHENWVWTAKEDETLIDQLSEAFAEKTARKISITDTKNLSKNINNSPNAPYQTLTVDSNGFMMAFYRASENDEWVYSEAISGQALPECSQLSEEEKMAFTNEWCYE